MTDWPTFLRSTRARLGLTQARLADLLSVTEQSIQNWEAGRSTPAHEGMMKMALDQIELRSKVPDPDNGFYIHDLMVYAGAHGWEDELGSVSWDELRDHLEAWLQERGLLPQAER